MKSSPLAMAYLFDFYGNMLTEKQRHYFDCYYNQDLSLSEIAENESITRQGARDVIFRAERSLVELEDALGFVARYAQIQDKLEAMAKWSDEIVQINENRYLNTDIHERASAICQMASALAAAT